MKKHILRIFTVLFILSAIIQGLCTGVCASSAGIFNEYWVSLTGLAQEYGNIYYGDEKPQFILSIENPDNISYSTAITTVVTDANGKALQTLNEGFELKPKTHIVKGIMPDVSKYGLYNIKVTLAGAFGEIVLSEDFSIAVKNESISDWIGVQFNIDDSPELENVKINTRLAKNAGFGLTRDDMRWGKVETVKDKYAIPENRKEDVKHTLDNGLKQLLIVSDSNNLYEEGKMPATATGINAYAKFSAYTALQYIGQNVTFEIANEPDYEYFTGWDAGGDDYAKLLVAAYDAIKTVNQNATVASAGICSLSNSHAQEFLDEMLSVSGITDKMDAFSFHPYNDNGMLSDEQVDEWFGLKTRKTFLEQVEYVKNKLDAKTSTGKDPLPLWITEYGVSSRNSNEWSYTELQQASDLVRTVTAAKSEPRIERFMVYNLRESGNDPAEHQHNFGIVDHDYNAKPAYLALAQLNNILYDAEYKNRYTEINYSGARGFSAFEFEKGGKENVFVLWEHIDKIATVKAVRDSTVETVTFEDGTSNAVIKLPEGVNAEYYDMYGNKMSVADGAYCALTMEPIYVVCKKENDGISIERNGNTVKVTGQAEKPFAEVTLAAEKSSGIKRFVNLDQQQADSNGNYSFEFTVPDNINSVWAVYVYDGSAKQLLGQYDSNGFAMCTEYFVNGTAVNSFDGLKEGNEVSVKLTVDSKNSARPTFAGAIYGRSGVMTALSTAEWSVGADTATAEIKLKFENNADFSAMKYFIWDESLKPMVQPIIISQQREDK